MDSLEHYATKHDLLDLEKRMTEKFENNIQQVSGHYSDVLKSNQNLTMVVSELNKTVTTLADTLQPVIDAQKLVVMTHSFLKWLGIPFVAVFAFLVWLFKMI